MTIETVHTCTSLDIDISQQLQKRPRKVSKALEQYLMSDSSVASAADTDSTDIRSKYKIEYYFTTLDRVIQQIDDRFNCQANETIQQMSAVCVERAPVRRCRQHSTSDNVQT